MGIAVVGNRFAADRDVADRRRVDVRFHLCRGNGVVILIGAGKREIGRNDPLADIGAGKRPGRRSHRNHVAADNAGKRGVRNIGIAVAVVGLIGGGKVECDLLLADIGFYIRHGNRVVVHVGSAGSRIGVDIHRFLITGVLIGKRGIGRSCGQRFAVHQARNRAAGNRHNSAAVVGLGAGGKGQSQRSRVNTRGNRLGSRRGIIRGILACQGVRNQHTRVIDIRRAERAATGHADIVISANTGKGARGNRRGIRAVVGLTDDTGIGNRQLFRRNRGGTLHHADIIVRRRGGIRVRRVIVADRIDRAGPDVLARKGRGTDRKVDILRTDKTVPLVGNALHGIVAVVDFPLRRKGQCQRFRANLHLGAAGPVGVILALNLHVDRIISRVGERRAGPAVIRAVGRIKNRVGIRVRVVDRNRMDIAIVGHRFAADRDVADRRRGDIRGGLHGVDRVVRRVAAVEPIEDIHLLAAADVGVFKHAAGHRNHSDRIGRSDAVNNDIFKLGGGIAVIDFIFGIGGYCDRRLGNRHRGRAVPILIVRAGYFRIDRVGANLGERRHLGEVVASNLTSQGKKIGISRLLSTQDCVMFLGVVCGENAVEHQARGRRGRPDLAGHLNRILLNAVNLKLHPDRVSPHILVFRRCRTPVFPVFGILDGIRIDSIIDFHKNVVGAVVDFRQAVGAVTEILERAVILRAADRTCVAVQVFVRNIVFGIAGCHTGTVNRHRTVGKGVLRLDVGAANKESVAGLELVATGRSETAVVKIIYRPVTGSGISQCAMVNRRANNDRVGGTGIVIERIGEKVITSHRAVAGKG